MIIMVIQLKNKNMYRLYYSFPAENCTFTSNLTNAIRWPEGKEEFTPGSHLYFDCRRGSMVGNRTVICLDTGEWNYKLPYCGMSIVLL